MIAHMNIVNADETNLKEWVNLSVMLFPRHTFEEMFDRYKEFLTSKKELGFLYRKDNQFIGFMNISVRNDYVNGAITSPVAFIEAIYVLPNYRRQGIAKEFIKFAESFAKQRGVTQLASDCLTENSSSENFHKRCGFIEKERIICFIKDI